MILMFDKSNSVSKVLREILIGIDTLIYQLVSWILEGIFNLSELMANQNLVQVIYKRIYVLLAVFMVFKLTVSFIQYVVDPDKMTDKENGVGKIVARIITMFAIMIIFPIIVFQPMDKNSETRNKPILQVFQNGVMKTLPKIILGIEIEDEDDNPTVEMDARENGKKLAINMLQSFYYPEECESGDNCNRDVFNDLSEIKDSAVEKGSDGLYKYHYLWPISTIAGIALVVILIGFAIDVAIRAFKLMILEMIAPVPIMSYIDPKSSKDGAFSSWIKSFTTTFLDLFFKLGTIYLLLLLTSRVFTMDNEKNLFGDNMSSLEGTAKTFVTVMLVLGLFKFAKDAPKFIKDALGIKDNGSGGGVMGKMASGLAGAAAGFAGGVATGGLAGGISGLASGYAAGKEGNAGKAFSQVRDEQAKLLGKTPGGLKGRAQNKMMQRSVMKHTGLNKKALDELEAKKIAADNELAAAQAELTSNPKDDTAKARYAQAAEKAAKANSLFNKADSLAGQIGLKKGFMEKAKRNGKAYTALRNSKLVNKAEDIGGKVKDKISEAHPVKSVHHSIDEHRYNESYADIFEDDRRNKKKAFSDLRGGVGSPNREEALNTYNEAKKQYKDDKKDARNDKKDGLL